MYSGLTFTRYSGRIIGAHQQIDRIAARHLRELLPHSSFFPSVRSILSFEGKNGPDGIKRKSPGQNEPWHFFDPLSDAADDYKKLLAVHYDGLVKELREKNNERAAFEAAWLAHAVVDGLTPAHHFPYEQEISRLRGGKANSTRQTYRDKLLFRGDTHRKTMHNMMQAWGPRGIFTAHFMFEWGFSFIIKPLRFPDARPQPTDLKGIDSIGYQEYFMQAAREIAMLNIYTQFVKKGWTSKLTRQIRQQLAPIMVRTVTTIWYQAAVEAGL